MIIKKVTTNVTRPNQVGRYLVIRGAVGMRLLGGPRSPALRRDHYPNAGKAPACWASSNAT